MSLDECHVNRLVARGCTPRKLQDYVYLHRDRMTYHMQRRQSGNKLEELIRIYNTLILTISTALLDCTNLTKY